MSTQERVVVFELMAMLARQAGTAQLQMPLTEAARSIGDALLQLQRQYPELRQAIGRCACAVGDAIVPRHAPLPLAQPIVLLPPVSGG